MSWPRRQLRRPIIWVTLFALAGLAVAGPISRPDGTGMQWDELVLAVVATWSSWTVLRRARAMDPRAARPWLLLGVGAALFDVSQLLSGLFPGPAFDGFGIDDVILFLGASSPVVVCAMLARRVRRTRWAALLLDGAAVTAALLVLSELLRQPLLDSADAPGSMRALVLAYGAYGAVIVGGAGALCTVSTVALRRSSTVMIFAVGWQATGAFAQGLAMVLSSPAWNTVSDVAVAMGLLTAAAAALLAPVRTDPRDTRSGAPRVSPVGIGLVVFSLLSVPVGIAVTLLAGRALATTAEAGCAVVFALVAVRVALRIREDGRMAEDLVRSEEDFRGLVESSSDGVAIVDSTVHLLFASPAARSLLGIPPDDRAEGLDLLALLDPEDRRHVRAAVNGTGAPVLHFRVRRADASTRELEATSSERPGSDKKVLYLRDVTSRRRRERELERMAYTDHLTGLPNRAQLFDELTVAAARGGHCLLVLDLDGFKAVNDVAGHETGDHLLIEVARRLNTVVREEDLVARLGGDEFAVVARGTLDEAHEIADRIVTTLASPYRVGEWTFPMGASVGVGAVDAGGGQLAFRAADEALRAAKQAGKGCVRIARDDAGPDDDGSELAVALAAGEVQVRFDAAVDADGRLGVVHALPVWAHPAGAVRGGELWALAERQGCTDSVLRWLLREACAETAAVDDALTVAVSLPPGAVRPDGVAALVAQALATTGLPTARLMLSLTEETLLTSPPALTQELRAVRDSGVRLCLDNYGVGHSFFALLDRVMLDVIRVDVASLSMRDPKLAMQMLTAIARTAAGFDITVIAGGMHTAEVRAAALTAGASLLHGRTVPHDLSAADLALTLDAATPA